MRKLIISGAVLLSFAFISGQSSVFAGPGDRKGNGNKGSNTQHTSASSSKKNSSQGGRPKSDPVKTTSTKGNSTGPAKSTTTSSKGTQGQQNSSKNTNTSKNTQGQQTSSNTKTTSKHNNGQQYPSKTSSPKGKGQAGGKDAMHKAGEIAKKYQSNKLPYGQSYKGKDGKNHKYDHCPSHLQHCMKPCSYNNWTKTCWLPKHGCSGYWCGESNNWYYWCEPRCCYLPTTYIEEYPSEEIEENVEEVVPVQYEQQVEGAAYQPAPVQTVAYTTVTPSYTTNYAPVYKPVCEVPCQKTVYVPSTHVVVGGHRPGYPTTTKHYETHGQSQGHKYPQQHNGGQKGQKSGKW
ncbi:hypothetical protein BH10PLA2_BH10PLA2_15760 [soil metagenome]